MKRNSFTILLANGHIITAYYYIVVGRLDNKPHSSVLNLENVVGLKRVLQGRKQEKYVS